jgi:hypothetical protein
MLNHTLWDSCCSVSLASSAIPTIGVRENQDSCRLRFHQSTGITCPGKNKTPIVILRHRENKEKLTAGIENTALKGKPKKTLGPVTQVRNDSTHSSPLSCSGCKENKGGKPIPKQCRNLYRLILPAPKIPGEAVYQPPCDWHPPINNWPPIFFSLSPSPPPKEPPPAPSKTASLPPKKPSPCIRRVLSNLPRYLLYLHYCINSEVR